MTWVNKGNRKTFVVKASTGTPLEPYVDYAIRKPIPLTAALNVRKTTLGAVRKAT